MSLTPARLRRAAAGLGLLLWAALAAGQPWQTYVKTVAPALQDQASAFAAVKRTLTELPAADAERFQQRFLAFALRDSDDTLHCNLPFDLGGAESVPGRTGALLFLCRQSLIAAGQAITTAFLIAMAAEQDQDRLARALTDALLSGAQMTVSLFEGWKDGNASGFTCTPAYRAYVHLNGLAAKDCWGLQPRTVKDFMWPRIRSLARQMNIAPEQLADNTLYFALAEETGKEVASLLFDFVVLHEAAHIMHGDVWNAALPAQAAQQELAADMAAFRVLAHRDAAESALSASLLSVFSMLHLSAVSSVWAANASFSPEMQQRIETRQQALACTLRSALRQPALPDWEQALLRQLAAGLDRAQGAVACP
ncbi:hypothetical protein [Variovorax terrae]|uniref:Peptidase M48 domain-containing protein n=1 Tax=Variovorax terrae TaxID=2923278 RepID=A0A9X2ARC8_9BURK|nr:hypothetical protein [Variovorax terrae]MCJ0765517.1 hypothetical protein [Variovorax terrae]